MFDINKFEQEEFEGNLNFPDFSRDKPQSVFFVWHTKIKGISL